MYEGRIRLTVRYDGTAFAGSQIQPGQRTVAGTLKSGLESLLQQQLHLLVAGRTDAGVHAEGNVCAFDARLPFPVERLAGVLNQRLPEDLRVRDASAAPPHFHPRFEAQARQYSYDIYLGDAPPVCRMRYVYAYPGAWNRQAVEAAVAYLPGKRAFHCFAEGTLDAKYAVCVLEPVTLDYTPGELRLWFCGNRFLRQMVRRLVGALVEVAALRATPEQFAMAVHGKLGFQFKPAPPRGLTLQCVKYESKER